MENVRMFNAINYASVAHKDQIRKSTGIPMIVHPFGVAMLLMDSGYDDDLVIAGLLHDVVEDCKGYEIEDIREKFGENVAEFVMNVTETDKSLPWKVRKDRHIDHMKHADLNSKILCAADKIHNLTSIYEDKKIYGENIYINFNATKDEVQWYYKSMYESIVCGYEKEDIELFNQLKEIVDLTFEYDYQI